MATILCVADDQVLTELLRYELTREGCAVRAAHSGRDALTLTRNESFDLIILDDALPDMDGTAVLSALRTVSRVPVVMLVARSRDGDIIAGPEPGADAYVAKPFRLQTLVERIKAVLRRGTGNLGADGTVQ